MNIDYSVDWDVDRIFGAKVGRVDGGRVDSDVCVRVESCDEK